MSTIHDLYVATNKELSDDVECAIAILQDIIDNGSSHSVPDCEDVNKDDKEELESLISDADYIFDAVDEIASNSHNDDFRLDFDGAEYRLIQEDAIWDIYVDEIKSIIEDCYDLKLDSFPDFVAWAIDWEQTAKNASVDGYGHTFSSYDHSEIESNGYYIFRTN